MESSSVPPNPRASKGASRVSVASMRNHVSMPTSQLGHRLRLPTQVLDSEEKTNPFLSDPLPAEMSPWATRLVRIFYRCFPVDFQPFRQRSSWMQWLLLMYCSFSCFVFSLAVFSAYRGQIVAYIPSDTSGQAPELAPLGTLPMDHLLSKVTSIYPKPKALDPYVIRASVDPMAVTACLWATDQDLHLISTWATRWTGPISLLITTAADASSAPHSALLRRLAALQTHSPLLNTSLTVHILHLAHSAERPRNTVPSNPNALLNLARLFAQTPRVALFPANLSTAPPRTLYRSLLTSAPASSLAITEPKATTRRPTVLTSRGQTGFPFAPLAPVVMARDDPLWCTERFFVTFASSDGGSVARAADWEECLWQVWLENFGDVEVKQTRGWLHDTSALASIMPSSSDSAPVMKLRRRLVAKYRSETCVLATRQLAALRSAEKALDAKKARWLKRVCRVWTNGAGQS